MSLKSVVGDVFSLLLQASGGGMMAGKSSSFSLGEHLILGGLGVQILFFGFFMVIEATYYIRLQNAIYSTQYNAKIINNDLKSFPNKFNNWRAILASLFLCSIFILVRSIYRVVEFTQGNNGYIGRHEWFLYIFDGLMMFFNCVFFISQDVSNYFLRAIPYTMGGEIDHLSYRSAEEGLRNAMDNISFRRDIDGPSKKI